MKDEDSDLELPDDRDSDSDAEENRPFRPRSMKGMMTAGAGLRDLCYHHTHNTVYNEHGRPFHPGDCCFWLLGRDARVIGNMQGGDSDEVSSVTVTSLLPPFHRVCSASAPLREL